MLPKAEFESDEETIFTADKSALDSGGKSNFKSMKPESSTVVKLPSLRENTRLV
jgi:hypothetical protein